jgi:hypothetical protein
VDVYIPVHCKTATVQCISLCTCFCIVNAAIENSLLLLYSELSKNDLSLKLVYGLV